MVIEDQIVLQSNAKRHVREIPEAMEELDEVEERSVARFYAFVPWSVVRIHMQLDFHLK